MFYTRCYVALIIMTDELFEKIQNFERKYADTLIEWLKLVKAQNDNIAWRPNNRSDEYGMKLYENSCKHDRTLRDFEKQVDKNILCTYLKYHCANSEQVTYPFSFSYKEPNVDLVLCP